MQRMLIISGHDPSTGAGMAADLRAASLLGIVPFSIITALTTQDENRFIGWYPTPDAVLSSQLELAGDQSFGAAKIGMLGSRGTVRIVARWLRAHPIPNLVFDPVLRSTSGGQLSENQDLDSIGELLPHVRCLTPNLDETEILTGIRPWSSEDMARAGKILCDRGAGAVLFKGGHREGAPVDHLWDAGRLISLPGERVGKGNVRGTGCWLSTLIAGRLAWGDELDSACTQAAKILRARMMTALSLAKDNAIMP